MCSDSSAGITSPSPSSSTWSSPHKSSSTAPPPSRSWPTKHNPSKLCSSPSRLLSSHTSSATLSACLWGQRSSPEQEKQSRHPQSEAKSSLALRSNCSSTCTCPRRRALSTQSSCLLFFCATSSSVCSLWCSHSVPSRNWPDVVPFCWSSWSTRCSSARTDR